MSSKLGFFKILMGGAACAAVVAAGLLLRPRSASAAYDPAALADHLKASYQLPADVDVQLGQPVASEVPGLDKLSVTLRRGSASQSDTIYISHDGRYYVMGGFKDVSINPDQERLAKMNLKDAPIRGDKGAPVALVEYTDFQCPFCKRGFDIVRDRILKEYPTQVRWYYKAFPLTSIHPWAEPAAIAVDCAGRQGNDAFWKLHDALFDNQNAIRPQNADDKILELAKGVGVNAADFQACYDARLTEKDVQKDMLEGNSMGIRSTPSFVVNGRLVSGADYDGLKAAIDAAIKSAGKK